MPDRADRLYMLLQKSVEQDLSFDEQMELDSYLDSYTLGKKKELVKELSDDDLLTKEFNEFYQLRKRAEQISQPSAPAHVIEMPRRKTGWTKWIAAASVIVFTAFGSYFLFLKDQKVEPGVAKTTRLSANDVAPGTYSAVLKLEDGKKILLDSAGLGLLAQQGNANIINEDGTVKYDAQGKAIGEVLYNTLETATGQSYALTLSDGTKVWLNAKSSLRFPVSLGGAERNVEMQGEVYFEVAKNANAPFKVSVNKPSGEKAVVEVLGTRFNINAYDDEATIQATVIEGKVKVSGFANNDSHILSPGQQVIIQDDGNMEVRDNINLDVITAWKEQTFYFKNSDLKSVMRELSRWYGIEVTYEGEIPNDKFAGMVSRNRNLSDVLKMLEASKVHFRIEEGKKITVMP